MNRLTGKTAIVTGAAQGLGLAIATRFVEEGARVQVDMSRRADVDRLVSMALKELMQIDILVNPRSPD